LVWGWAAAQPGPCQLVAAAKTKHDCFPRD
jgi:hypothetical protein